MFDSTENPNPRPTAEESYSSATGASNLRVEAQRRTPADMVIAAGMSQRRLGLALIRLVSEWDRTAKPKALTPKEIEAVAATFAVEPPKTPHAGMVRVLVDGQPTYKLPLVLAAEYAQAWYEHDMGLTFQRLKSLPGVRDALVSVARVNGWDGDIHLVAAVLQWWLHPTCPACHGVRFKVVAGTGRTSSKACGKCRGEGERKVPHSYAGRRLLSYINAARGEAIADLRGKFRHQKRQPAQGS